MLKMLRSLQRVLQKAVKSNHQVLDHPNQARQASPGRPLYAGASFDLAGEGTQSTIDTDISEL